MSPETFIANVLLRDWQMSCWWRNELLRSTTILDSNYPVWYTVSYVILARYSEHDIKLEIIERKNTFYLLFWTKRTQIVLRQIVFTCLSSLFYFLWPLRWFLPTPSSRIIHLCDFRCHSYLNCSVKDFSCIKLSLIGIHNLSLRQLNNESPILYCLSFEGCHHNSVSLTKLCSYRCSQCYLDDNKDSTSATDIM